MQKNQSRPAFGGRRWLLSQCLRFRPHQCFARYILPRGCNSCFQNRKHWRLPQIAVSTKLQHPRSRRDPPRIPPRVWVFCEELVRSRVVRVHLHYQDTVVVLKTETVQRPFEKKVKNLQMEADRLELIARHNFAPSNRPHLFARPMRVQIVLGARRYPAWFTHGRWPVPFRAAGLRGRRNRR